MKKSFFLYIFPLYFLFLILLYSFFNFGFEGISSANVPGLLFFSLGVILTSLALMKGVWWSSIFMILFGIIYAILSKNEPFTGVLGLIIGIYISLHFIVCSLFVLRHR